MRVATDGTTGKLATISTLPENMVEQEMTDAEFSIFRINLAGVPSLAQQIAVNLIQIDRDVDAIYAALLGNREAEYTLAEKEALAFQAAGYAGAVPPCVQAWATAKSQTATWATDDILAAATLWRTAQLVIRANRLACKEAVRNAVDGAALIAAQAQWAGFLAVIKPQLGL